VRASDAGNGYDDDDGGAFVATPNRSGKGKGKSSGDELADATQVADDYAEELTDEEKDAIAQRCLRIFNVIMLVMGAALCGAALYASTISMGGLGSTLTYVVAAVGGAVFLITTVGLVASCCNATQVLLLVRL
jgi:hypothetical protein